MLLKTKVMYILLDATIFLETYTPKCGSEPGKGVRAVYWIAQHSAFSDGGNEPGIKDDTSLQTRYNDFRIMQVRHRTSTLC